VGKHPSTADQFPFPGAAPPMPGAESSSSSSSSSDSSSSSSSGRENPNDTVPPGSGPPLNDKGDNPAGAVRSARRKLPKVEKLQSDEERASEDLYVARFYEQFGDLNAAYLRARDAVKIQPSDPEVHFVLGHLAERLNKRDEAIAEYNTYLQLDPDGEKIKQARKAISQLQRP
jgi:tetratricopeptide (TPR) repeat protein